ncbi:putative carrier protein [Toxoplasma gondii FOU]|uniref:Putative carrier protein n=1 Tax=Toxoplasma gondii FOU TaxID=943167 RepID=A0A086LC80_TOXGO|nr:putative carrier protein [Toxoplasma gondii FOU]
MTPGVATRDASAGGAFRDLSKGAVLQCVEAATLGMPFEVWKTRMGRYRSESTVEAFQQIYREGGVRAYWRGLAPKLVESASKGAVLLYSKVRGSPRRKEEGRMKENKQRVETAERKDELTREA